MRLSPSALLVVAATAASASPRYLMYFDQWHTATLPPRDVTAGVNYVVTAFASSAIFVSGSSYTPFKPLSEIRPMFDAGTKMCMAIGGWGDVDGFSVGAASSESRKAYAKNVAEAVDRLGYDCVDVDWEYPGGNGQNYRSVPNDQKKGEIETYPLLLAEIKQAIGPKKELSIAVPGKEVDMIAFTAQQVPKIDAAVDFVNVMSYDLMNRRDTVTNHHTSVEGSLNAVQLYLDRGMNASKINLGFAFYAKYFVTKGQCNEPVGCPTVLLESSDGSDTQQSGAVTFEVENYGNQDFLRAMSNGREDSKLGGEWYWDSQTRKFWTWDTPKLIARKFDEIVKAKKLGGVFAWSLAQDSHDWSHFKALQAGVKTL